jgi:NMD protein affecting ribosome stability and mRNA decay
VTAKGKRYNPDLWPKRTHMHEFPKGKEGLVFCKTCSAVYFKKSWHHNLKQFKKLRENLPVKLSACPACAMIASGKFEGRIALRNVPLHDRENLLNLIRAFTHRAWQRDPMDRLIDINSAREGLEVTTTENQLAVKLAKKIQDVFKRVKTRISYGHAKDKAADIVIEFLS